MRPLTHQEESAASRGGFFLHLATLALSGAVLGAAFYLADFSFFGFLLLAPLVVHALRSPTLLRAALGGYVYGFAYLLVAGAWAIESYSARWASVEFASAVASLGAVITLTVGTSALLIATFGGLTYLLAKRVRPTESFSRAALFAVLVALLFAALEYVRLPLFALITLGPGGTGEFFSSGFLGYLASTFPGVRILAGVGEVHALTFVLALVNVVIALAFSLRTPKARLSGYAAVAVILALLNGGLSLFAPEAERTITILGLATEVEGGRPEEVRETAARDALLSRTSDLHRADLVVFPETYGMSLVGIFGSGTPPVIASRRVARPNDALFTGALFQEGKAVSYAEKRILVPYGEYIPYVARAVGSFADPESTNALVASLNAVPGKKEGRVFDGGATQPGLLFCNEAWAPEATRWMREGGADIVIVVASHASFEHPALLEAFEERVLSVRAAALKMPLVQVTNRGRSYVVDASGEILARYPSGETFLVEVPLPARP